MNSGGPHITRAKQFGKCNLGVCVIEVGFWMVNYRYSDNKEPVRFNWLNSLRPISTLWFLTLVPRFRKSFTFLWMDSFWLVLVLSHVSFWLEIVWGSKWYELRAVKNKKGSCYDYK